jgi:uncharacterized protein (DUF1330 family)
MKYYSVVEIDLSDDSWIPAYVQNVTAMVERAGGRYLARTSHIEKIEGHRAAPQIMVIIEWPSKQIAERLYQSEEYRPFLESRIAGAKNQFFLVAGEDVANVAKMPD